MCDTGYIYSSDGTMCVPKCDPATQKLDGNTCVCDESKGFLTDASGNCYKKKECLPPEVPNADFTFCECKPPNLMISGKCQTPNTCSPNMTLNKLTNECECLDPNVINPKTGKCELKAKCDPTTQIWDPNTNTCVCDKSKGFLTDKSGKCYKKVVCEPPAVPNVDFTFCECKPPNLMINGKCQTRNKCPPNMTLNERTNQCECLDPNRMISGNCEVRTECDGNTEKLNENTNRCECKDGFENRGDGCVKTCDPSTQELKDNKCVCKNGFIEDAQNTCHEPLRIICTLLRTLSYSKDQIEGSLTKSLPGKPAFVRQIMNDSKFIYFYKQNKKLWQEMNNLQENTISDELETQFRESENSKDADILKRSELIDRHLYKKFNRLQPKPNEKFFYKLILDVFAVFKSIFNISRDDFINKGPGDKKDPGGKNYPEDMFGKYLEEIVKRTLLKDINSSKTLSDLVNANLEVSEGLGRGLNKTLRPALFIYVSKTDIEKTNIFNKSAGGARKTIKHRIHKTIRQRKLRNKKTKKRVSKKKNTRRK
jgi:hypothetical protein